MSIDHAIHLPELMKFVSGTPTIPPLGLQSRLAILFKHDCANDKTCRCKLTTMTCDLSLSLPMHYKDTTDMMTAIVDSIKLSQGFHLLWFSLDFYINLYKGGFPLTQNFQTKKCIPTGKKNV